MFSKDELLRISRPVVFFFPRVWLWGALGAVFVPKKNDVGACFFFELYRVTAGVAKKKRKEDLWPRDHSLWKRLTTATCLMMTRSSCLMMMRCWENLVSFFFGKSNPVKNLSNYAHFFCLFVRCVRELL